MGRPRGAACSRVERGNDEQQRKFSPYEVGLHLPHRVDTEVQAKGALLAKGCSGRWAADGNRVAASWWQPQRIERTGPGSYERPPGSLRLHEGYKKRDHTYRCHWA